MNTEPLTEDEREVGWALLTGPARGVQLDSLTGRVALPLPRVKGAVRSLADAGHARATPAGWWRLTDSGRLHVAQRVCELSERERDRAASRLVGDQLASFAEVARVLGISKSAAFHRYGDQGDETG